MTAIKSLAILLLILLAACAPVATLTPPAALTATPVNVPPTPTLRPADDFVAGINEVPPGKVLFVEYWRISDGIGNCPGAAMIDFPGYRYSAGELEAHTGVSGSTGELDAGVIGIMGVGDSNRGAMGGGISSELIAIQSLPYPIEHQLGTLHSIYSQGEIVVDIWGQAYWLEPGQSWVLQVEGDPSSECHTVSTYRFTNYGLLDEGSVKLP